MYTHRHSYDVFLAATKSCDACVYMATASAMMYVVLDADQLNTI